MKVTEILWRKMPTEAPNPEWISKDGSMSSSFGFEPMELARDGNGNSFLHLVNYGHVLTLKGDHILEFLLTMFDWERSINEGGIGKSRAYKVLNNFEVKV